MFINNINLCICLGDCNGRNIYMDLIITIISDHKLSPSGSRERATQISILFVVVVFVLFNRLPFRRGCCRLADVPYSSGTVVREIYNTSQHTYRKIGS